MQCPKNTAVGCLIQRPCHFSRRACPCESARGRWVCARMKARAVPENLKGKHCIIRIICQKLWRSVQPSKTWGLLFQKPFPQSTLNCSHIHTYAPGCILRKDYLCFCFFLFFFLANISKLTVKQLWTASPWLSRQNWKTKRYRTKLVTYVWLNDASLR